MPAGTTVWGSSTGMPRPRAGGGADPRSTASATYAPGRCSVPPAGSPNCSHAEAAVGQDGRDLPEVPVADEPVAGAQSPVVATSHDAIPDATDQSIAQCDACGANVAGADAF